MNRSVNPAREIHRIVWNFRHENQKHWPTPNPSDSLRFAFTEAGEALDAQLRLISIYKRNNSKTPDQQKVLDELADVAIMLATAVGLEYNVIAGTTGVDASLDVICRWVSKVWDVFERGRNNGSWRSDACFLINTIARYPDLDLIERVESRLLRIKAKHVPEVDMIQDVGGEVILVG